MFIKQKILNLYNSVSFARRAFVKIFINKCVIFLSNLEQLKDKPSISNIIFLYKKHLDLIFKRLLAFVIDSSIIMLFLLGLEFIVCLIILSNEDIYLFTSSFFLYESSNFFHTYFSWVIYVCVIGFLMSGISGYSLGYRLFKIQVNWPNVSKPYLFIGSALRTFMPFYIPFIFFDLVFLSYAINSSPIELPKLESVMLIFLVLIWPISIVISRGSASIYDYFFYTKVTFKNGSTEEIKNKRSIAISILLTVVISIILTTYFHSSSLFKRAAVLSEDYSFKVYPKIVNRSKVSALLYEKIIRHQNSKYTMLPIYISRNSTVSTGDNDDGNDFVKWNIIVLIRNEDDEFIRWLINTIEETLIVSNDKMNDYEIVLKKHMQINMVGITRHKIFQYDNKSKSYVMKEMYRTVGVNFFF